MAIRQSEATIHPPSLTGAGWVAWQRIRRGVKQHPSQDSMEPYRPVS
jgi:hypothetical protein